MGNTQLSCLFTEKHLCSCQSRYLTNEQIDAQGFLIHFIVNFFVPMPICHLCVSIAFRSQFGSLYSTSTEALSAM
uniref:Uncharacterized protein n=1 Tax=Arundo donax TaxID=35708 RepID=A0A0A8YZQ7_ARUDO